MNNPRLTMAWAKKTYLQLVIKWKVEIDMTSYPSKHLILPRLADKEHASQVVEGWKNGKIKWIDLLEPNVEEHEKELVEIMKDTSANKSKSIADGPDGEETNQLR